MWVFGYLCAQDGVCECVCLCVGSECVKNVVCVCALKVYVYVCAIEVCVLFY